MTHLPTRRHLLKQLGAGSIALSASTLHSGIRCKANTLWDEAVAGATGNGTQRNLVVVQLSGGNDGLNTVIPYADDLYHKNRQTLRYRENEVLRIDDYLGWHPDATGLSDLMQDGHLAILQGVGYPNPNRSHFESMDLWHTAHSPSRAEGWLGKTVDQFQGMKDPRSVFIGRGVGPLALQSRNSIPLVVRRLEQLRLRDRETRMLLESLSEPAEKDPQIAAQVTASLRATLQADRQLSGAVASTGDATYPATSLAQDLQTVATLIRSNISARVFYVTLDGFDTHANQRNAHATLMRQLGDATKAFIDDLKADDLLDQTLVMAFSEFGRRVHENGSQGTDHGVAGPVFLAGGQIQSSLVGDHPDLDQLIDGDLQHAIDYRSVYATILERWFELPSRELLGEQFELLDSLLA